MGRYKKYTSHNAQELQKEIKSRDELERIYRQRVGEAKTRIGRIEERYGDLATTEEVKRDIKSLPKGTSRLSKRALAQGIARANKYIDQKTSTITGFNEFLKNTRNTLADMGIGINEETGRSNIRKKDIPAIFQYLDDLRERLDVTRYDSGEMIDRINGYLKSHKKPDKEAFIAEAIAQYGSEVSPRAPLPGSGNQR